MKDKSNKEPPCYCDQKQVLWFGHEPNCPAKGFQLKKVAEKFRRRCDINKNYLP